MTMDSMRESQYFDDVISIMFDMKLDTLPYTLKSESTSINLSESILLAIRHLNLDKVKFSESQQERMEKYPATKSYTGPSNVGYIDLKIVQGFISENFSKEMHTKIYNDLSFYFCDSEKVYSIPWHTVEVQLLPIIFSYQETDLSCEIILSSAGFMTPTEEVLYYPNIGDTDIVGVFKVTKTNMNKYEAIPGIYEDQISNLKRIKVKFIKSQSNILIDEVSIQ